jgi:hypothetical protein
MSKRYPGGIIRKTPQTPSQTSAQGIWDMASVTQAVKENTWPIAGVPDPISKSLRFRSSASAYLNRTFGTPTLSTKWTWSGWFKLGYASTYYTIFDGGSPDTRFGRDPSTNQLYVNNDTTNFIITTPVYRDYSAWYHAVLAFDSSQGTASNRLRLYINGSEVTAFATDNRSSISGAIGINTATAHGIGRQPSGGSAYFDGYMAEVYFVDGQQLTPSSFGNTNDQTGVWQPIAYTGTYGANGFYLPFSNTASTSTLGYDFSGNSNNWTPNNISLTSGSTYDSMNDVPTQWIPYNTTGDVGALWRGNYCVWNAVDNANGEVTLKNANLEATRTSSSADWAAARGTMFVSSGKWYFEMQSGMPDAGFYTMGVSNASFDTTGYTMSSSNSWACYLYDGNKANGSGSSYGTGATSTSDVFQCAVDMDSGKIWWGKNGTFFASGDPAAGTNAAFTNLSGQSVAPTAGVYGSSSSGGAIINFGQRPFSYTPPSGFKTLNTTNLPTPTIGVTASTTANKYFDATLYTGNGSALTVTNSGAMQPDLLWTKRRSAVADHYLQDSVRGVNKALFSDLTDSEYTITSTTTTLNSNGFSFNGSESGLNANTSTYVAWQWRASNATAVTNTAGSITSSVSANTTAGFSIVTYTGTGSNATVGHGLGVAPSMVIVKSRSDASTYWCVYQSAMWATSGTDYTLLLPLNNGAASRPTLFNSTQPSSSVFSIGTNGGVNNSGATYVAYCFAQVAGYSAFGSYTGNGSSDGTFVYLGFRPKYILMKKSSSTEDWAILDSSRSPYNVTTADLYANLSAAEETGNARADLLSNGIKFRTGGGQWNLNGATYIYMAFAESPFKYSLAR